MTQYTVLVTDPAVKDLADAYEWLVAQTPLNAPGWYNGLLDAVLSLETMPGRCPLARDREEDDSETRQLIYGDKQHAYLITFAIRGSNVLVWHVRHAARDTKE